jgi:hypothetical protein
MQVMYPYLAVSSIVFFFLLLNLFAYVHYRTQPIYSDLFLAGVLILFAGLRGSSLDFEQYQKMFESIQTSTDQNLLEQVLLGKDVLFGLMMVAISAVGLGNLSIFLISAILSVGLKVFAFREAFENSILGLSLYFYTFYFLHDFTQIRLAIALAFCFVSFVFLIKEKRLAYFLFSICAIGFHAQTALYVVATLPLLTNMKGKYLYIFISIVIMGLSFSLIDFVLDFASFRPGVKIAASDISSNIILFVILNAFIVGTAYVSSMGNFKNLYDDNIAKASFYLFLGGIFFLFLTLKSSEVLGMRTYEMFSAFGVFVIITSLRSTPKVLTIVACLSYFILNLALLFRSDLLLKYTINSSFG